MMKEDTIKILGARVHNLKNVDLEIPRRKLVVITGLSGSGKSSLAFDTIYAEGQRRYMETLSTYARQFVGTMERPDVDKITGLSPVVAIEQKTTNKNPRSTVGTVTEINDFLRLLYARASRAYSPVTGEEMVHYTDEQIAELILGGFAGRKIALMAPIVKGRKGHYRELFETLAKKGYIYARIDGEIREISSGMRLDRYKIHTIDLVVDRLVVGEEARDRVMTSLRESLRQGKGTMAVYDYGTEQQRFYSRHLMCPSTGVAFEDPAPHTFSFNSPKGACPHCNGLGEEAVFDIGKIIPDTRLSLRDGEGVAISVLSRSMASLVFASMSFVSWLSVPLWPCGHRDRAYYLITVPVSFSRFSECLIVTLRTPLATAFSAFSTLGIIPLLTMPPALSVAYDSAVISRMSVVSSSGSCSTPFFSKQKTSSVGAIRAAPSATDEATLSALQLSSVPCPSCMMAQNTGVMPAPRSSPSSVWLTLSMSPTKP